MRLEDTFSLWLKNLKIEKSKKQISAILLQHPEYPSAVAITDTLSYLGIENGVYHISKENLPNIPGPYLVHLLANGGEFKIVKENPFKEIPNFETTWNKIVIVAEKPQSYNNTSANVTTKEKRDLFIIYFFLTAFVLLNLISIFFAADFTNISLLSISLIGIGLSYIGISKEFGISSYVAEMVCSNASCDDVIKSPDVQLPFDLKFTDLSIIWFSFLNIITLAAINTNSAIVVYPLLSIASTIGLGLVCYSIFFQARISKQWCRLCLCIATLLILQFTLLVRYLTDVAAIRLLPTVGTITIFGLSATAWLMLKSLLAEKKTLESSAYENARFKFNELTWQALIRQQTFIGVDPFNYEIQLGNADAPIQITIVNSITCTPCGDTYKTIEKVLQESEVLIGVRMRFTLYAMDIGNSREKILKYILNILLGLNDVQSKRKVLTEWYNNKDFERFKAIYDEYYDPNNEANVEALLADFKNFVLKTNTTSTPTVFINDWKLPKVYTVKDIKDIAKYAVFENLNSEVTV